jgi:glycosyltransferase involved in cell wall biosynthesis
MKILFFIDGLRLGGKERRLLELLKGLKNRHEFEIAIASVWKEIHYKDFYQLNIPLFFLEKKSKFDPSIFFKFYNLTKKLRPDIVHTWSNMNTSYSLFSKIFINFKLVNSQIADAPHRVSWFSIIGVETKINFKFSDRILSNSRAGLISYRAPVSKSRYIYNGFDFKRLRNQHKPEKIKEKMGIKTKYVVAMVASFSEKKDYKTYFDAAKNILKKRGDITFLTIGDGVYFNKYKQLYGQNDNIKFLGLQLYVDDILPIFDVGVLSTYTEGISNSIIEYMAWGKPVIATEGGGTCELVLDGETGFLIKQQDSDHLIEKIEYLLKNGSKAREMGLKGRERIVKKFDSEKMINKYCSLYKNI